MYDIDVRILGEEYKDKEFTGRDLCRKRGMHIYFNERSHRFSSSDLRQRVVRVVDNQKEAVYNGPTNPVT
jgi:glycerol-3-phosphate cytidylyltransferase